jgi:hypothetical protein
VKAQGKIANDPKTIRAAEHATDFFEIAIKKSIGARGATGLATRHFMAARIGRAITSN